MTSLFLLQTLSLSGFGVQPFQPPSCVFGFQVLLLPFPPASLITCGAGPALGAPPSTLEPKHAHNPPCPH